MYCGNLLRDDSIVRVRRNLYACVRALAVWRRWRHLCREGHLWMVIMSLTLSIIIFFTGAAASGLLAKALRRNTSTAFANAVAFMGIWLSAYPLITWLSGGSRFSFATLLLLMLVGGVATYAISVLSGSALHK
jgi:hypothetical protein